MGHNSGPSTFASQRQRVFIWEILLKAQPNQLGYSGKANRGHFDVINN